VNHFAYRGRALHADGVPLARIAAEVGTPTYVYAAATLRRHFRVMDQAFAARRHLVCYAVKANSNLAVLALFAELGAGFDIVSGGELHRVLQAGGDARKVVFSGVGKTPEEIELALRHRILAFNVESAEELDAIAAVARRKKRRAPIALRVNPDVDPKTHPYIATGLKQSKFGIPMAEARKLYRAALRRPELDLLGLDCHIGSQLTQLGPLQEALHKLTALFRQLRGWGVPLRHLDVGGGLGISYDGQELPDPRAYAEVVLKATADLDGVTLVLEPGRVLVGNAGVLLTRVLYRKQTPGKRFVVVDAGMNDLVRPALYGAHHAMLPVQKRGGAEQVVDVVGPVCESTDVLAKRRRLPALEAGELLAIHSAGAYGMSMASNYNSRPRPAEVLVDGRAFSVVRRRESPADLVRGEQVAGRRR
jgi:diaminopimelate decarboxylase